MRDMGKWNQKSVATCSATDAKSSRGVIIGAGLCPYNRGIDAAVAEGVILCESCGTRTCRSCIKKLRLATIKEIARCKQWRPLLGPELQWLVQTRSHINTMFDSSMTDVLKTVGGKTRFTSKCVFCWTDTLPEAQSAVARLPKTLGYPVAQPVFGKRTLHVLPVRTPRT